jgi:hypothetical protein
MATNPPILSEFNDYDELNEHKELKFEKNNGEKFNGVSIK